MPSTRWRPTEPGQRRRGGFTLAEMLLALVITALLSVAVWGAVFQGVNARAAQRPRAEALREARFAIERIRETSLTSERLFFPRTDDPATAWDESVRDVLGLTLAPHLDRDGDGIADADNDGDGRSNEDPGDDIGADGNAGAPGIDDDGDGVVDGDARDDDEDGAHGEDPVNGIDDDGDGLVDEDPRADWNGDGKAGIAGIDDDGDGSVDEGDKDDDDEDGQVDEDGFEPVVYFLSGGSLVERAPNLDPANGADTSDRVLATGVTAFEVRWLSTDANARSPLIQLRVELAAPDGPVVLETRVRVGSAL